MGLTSALNTSLNGLQLNETTIDVLGNNIANAGTNGFKASKVQFTSQLSRTLSVGSRPTTANGGTNPRQIGLGALTAAINKDFTQGSITNSTSPSDLAIQGDGFFILDGSDGTSYTRDGTFSLNSDSLLVNAQGLRVRGYGVDTDFNLVTTQLSDIRIPLGDLNVAQETRNMSLSGALYPTGTLGTNGSHFTSDALTDAGNANAAITDTTLLTDVQNTSGTMFTVGDVVTFQSRKGSRLLEQQTLTVTATTTVAELTTMMQNGFGITSGSGVPNDGISGAAPGVTVTAGGQIQVVGNMGTVNDIGMAFGDLSINGSPAEVTFTKSASANGESAITDFVVFDSLGSPVTLKMTAVLEARDTGSTTFRYFFESNDDSRPATAIGSGTIIFDGNGHVTTGGQTTLTIERDNTAANNMQILVDLSQISGISSSSAGSTLNLGSQDGSAPGTLTNFVIDETGIINGVFDNGVIRTLGQVTLARFSNSQGLVENGSGTFKEGVSSGPPFLATPGNFGAGTLRAGAIELSNTDIGRNLVDLIVASTNYRGNARVISSVQQLVDELLVLGR